MIADIAKQVAQFEADEVLQLLERITPIFRHEPRLINLPNSPLLFIGDTHGDWDATKAILTRFWKTPTVFVFLGDYVDRGPHQIENINLLFQLKTTAPTRIILLRGNHETPRVNRDYGFYDEVQQQLGDITKHYWTTFAHLPLAAVNRKHRIFAVHGGIPDQLVGLNEINSLPQEVEPENPITIQILWNDPNETVKGFDSSCRGSRIRAFGQDVTVEFMDQNNLALIVRAHEVFEHGYHEFFEGRIISLFSCRHYRRPIAGKALLINASGDRELVPI